VAHSDGAGIPLRRPFTYRRRLAVTGLSLFAPFMVLFTLTVLAPLGYAVYLSLYRQQMIGGSSFVGFTNFLRAVEDPLLRAGLGRVLLFMAIQLPLLLVLSLFCAVAIDSGKLRLPAVFRLGIFLPFAVPTVVASLMWGYIYGSQFGLVGGIARALGLTAPNLLSHQLILPSLANISLWQSTGYNMLIFYAALRSIPPELYEAAEIDGAGEFRKLWHIKLPALRPALYLTIFFGLIGGIQLFTEPSVLQTSAPTVIISSFTPNLYTYNLAFNGGEYNYSAAVSVLMGAVTIAAVLMIQIGSSRRARSARA
jgi:multiple sugar transport system permease protein